MGTVRRGKPVASFVDSDNVVRWVESLSGAITTINTEHGGISGLVEGAAWDESRTPYLLNLLGGLKESISILEQELRDHVNGKLA